MKQIAIVITLLSFGFFLGAGISAAAETVILPGTGPSLLGNGGILDQLYGLGNLQRVNDDFDQVWFPANGNATAVAKYAAFSQDFGYIPDLNQPGFDDDSYVHLFNVPSMTNGIGLGGPSATLNSGNVPFLWALDPSEAPLWTSLQSQNSDGLDHMVTWRIVNTPSSWVIAWEDVYGGYDQDYTDLVVEVRITPVPIPGAVWLLGSGLIGIVGIRKKFKK